MVKNTLLGLAVFESYSAVIERFAPPTRLTDDQGRRMDGHQHLAQPQDPYARASVMLHLSAGAAGGLSHGLAASLWDAIAATGAGAAGAAATATSPRSAPRFLLHHSTAHAVLFGAYEGSKRGLLSCLGNDGSDSSSSPREIEEATATQQHHHHRLSRVESLGVVALAGGLAGQFQYVVSHYSEQLVLSKPQPRTAGSRSSRKPVTLSPILFRRLLAAFLPSSIAFVAFEYGRNDL